MKPIFILVDHTAAIYISLLLLQPNRAITDILTTVLFLKCWLIIPERIGKATCKTVTSGQAILNIVFLFF